MMNKMNTVSISDVLLSEKSDVEKMIALIDIDLKAVCEQYVTAKTLSMARGMQKIMGIYTETIQNLRSYEL